MRRDHGLRRGTRWGRGAATLLVRVVESGSARPLANAEVTALDAGVSRLTNERGEARVQWPPSHTLRLRVLRRIDFHLTGLKDDDEATRVEGLTIFRMASPFISVPDSTFALFWRHPPASPGNWGTPGMIQLLRVKELTYRKAQPPPP